MAEHDEHSSFIKTPQQLITVVLLAFVVPIIGIVMLVQLVVNRPQADPAALSPEAVAASLARLLSAPTEARAMGEAGRRRALALFTLERHAAAMETLYVETIRRLHAAP